MINARRFLVDIKSAHIGGPVVAIALFAISVVFPQALDTKTSVESGSFFGQSEPSSPLTFLDVYDASDAISRVLGQDSNVPQDSSSVKQLFAAMEEDDRLYFAFHSSLLEDPKSESEEKIHAATLVGSEKATNAAIHQRSRNTVQLYDGSGYLRKFHAADVNTATPQAWLSESLPRHLELVDLVKSLVCLCSQEDLAPLVTTLNDTASAEAGRPLYLTAGYESRYGAAEASFDFWETLRLSTELLALLAVCSASLAAFTVLWKRQALALKLEVFQGLSRSVALSRQQFLLGLFITGPIAIGYSVASSVVKETSANGLPLTYHIAVGVSLAALHVGTLMSTHKQLSAAAVHEFVVTEGEHS